MGSFLIIISIVTIFLQYRTRQLSSLLHVSQIVVYFVLFAMLLIGIIIQIDARRK